MEEDFYAAIKLKTGEEIFGKVLPCDENNKFVLLVMNPIIIDYFELRGKKGYKVEPWIKMSEDELFVIDMDDVITISESKSKQMIFLHDSYSKQFKNNKIDSNSKANKMSRSMGYIANVTEAKKILEKIYRTL